MKSSRINRLIRGFVLVALTSVVGVGGAFAQSQLWPDDAVLPGLKIDGTMVPSGADVAALIEARAVALTSRRVELVLESEKVGEAPRLVADVTLGELGLEVDQEQVLKRALSLGHDGDRLERASLAQKARKGELDIPLSLRVHSDVTLARLAPIKEAEDVSPTSARLDLDNRAVIPERPGRYIDTDAIVTAVSGAALDPSVTRIVLPVAIVAPRISSEFLSKLDIHEVVGEFETRFSRQGDQARRSRNIEGAASKLDGVVLPPGEVISFNSIVGDRSEENGFQKAWEIFKGEMVEGIGGGTCQVASTFYAAAFFAGFDVLERLPHSRPSAYIPIGLDATVVYPNVDLKFRNPHSFPIVIHASIEKNKLKVELLGASKTVRVSFSRELVETIPYTRKVVEGEGLSGKKVIVKQHGIRGFKVKRQRVLTFADGTKRVEKALDSYPPTTEIYEVPRDFDESLLPPLPEVPAEEEAESENTGDKAKEAPPVPAASPAQAPSPAASTSPLAASGVIVQDAPGAHAPTAGQANPAKMWSVSR